MTQAPARLKRRAEFLRVAAGRRKWAAPGLVLQAAPMPGQGTGETEGPEIRVGFTVSRKVGNSVERNRARRRLRAAVESIMPVHAVPGWDYVVIGRQGTLRRPFGLLLQDLTSALKRVGAYRAPPRDDMSTPGSKVETR